MSGIDEGGQHSPCSEIRKKYCLIKIKMLLKTIVLGFSHTLFMSFEGVEISN